MWYILNTVFVPFLSCARHWLQLMIHEHPYENYKNFRTILEKKPKIVP